MKLIKLLCICLLILTASNVNAKDISQSLATCSQINLNADRLACFDLLSSSYNIKPSVVAVAKKTSTQTNKNVNTKIIASIPKKTLVDKFGSSHLKVSKDEAEANKSIALTVSKIKKNVYNELTLYFKNGQVWQQKGEGYFKVKVNDEVRLTKGALGTVHMKQNDNSSNRSIRVKRIK